MLTKEYGKKEVDLVTIPFLKKYLEYAKGQCKPVLTQEASDNICVRYAELRNREEGENNMHKVSFTICRMTSR